MLCATKKATSKVGGKKLVSKVVDPIKEAQEKRAKQLKKIEDQGVPPPEGEESRFFTVKDKDVFTVDPENLIPVGAPQEHVPTAKGLSDGQAMRGAIGHDNVFVIDADSDVFQTTYDEKLKKRVPWEETEFTLTDREAHLFRYTTACDKKGKEDPKRRCTDADLMLKSNEFKMDVAEFMAMHAAFKASRTTSTAFFQRFILGVMHDPVTGALQRLERDSEQWGPEETKMYEEQRAILKKNISKLLLLYPYKLDPVHGSKGNIYKLGSIRAKLNDKNGDQRTSTFKPAETRPVINKFGEEVMEEVQVFKDPKLKKEYAPQLCMQVTVQNADDTLSGPHDRIEIIPLSTVCVAKVLEMNASYKLGFECLEYMNEVRKTSSLSLATFREKHRACFASDPPPPPKEDPSYIDETWLEAMQYLNFRKVYLMPRTWEKPVPDDKAVAVYIERDRPEHLNGCKLPNLLKVHDKEDARFEEVRAMLDMINHTQTHTKKRKEADDDASGEIQDLKNKLEVQGADLEKVQAELAKYKSVLDLSNNKKRIKLDNGDNLHVKVLDEKSSIWIKGRSDANWFYDVDNNFDDDDTPPLNKREMWVALKYNKKER